MIPNKTKTDYADDPALMMNRGVNFQFRHGQKPQKNNLPDIVEKSEMADLTPKAQIVCDIILIQDTFDKFFQQLDTIKLEELTAYSEDPGFLYKFVHFDLENHPQHKKSFLNLIEKHIYKLTGYISHLINRLSRGNDIQDIKYKLGVTNYLYEQIIESFDLTDINSCVNEYNMYYDLLWSNIFTVEFKKTPKSINPVRDAVNALEKLLTKPDPVEKLFDDIFEQF